MFIQLQWEDRDFGSFAATPLGNYTVWFTQNDFCKLYLSGEYTAAYRGTFEACKSFAEKDFKAKLRRCIQPLVWKDSESWSKMYALLDSYVYNVVHMQNDAWSLRLYTVDDFNIVGEFQTRKEAKLAAEEDFYRKVGL